MQVISVRPALPAVVKRRWGGGLLRGRRGLLDGGGGEVGGEVQNFEKERQGQKEEREIDPGRVEREGGVRGEKEKERQREKEREK